MNTYVFIYERVVLSVYFQQYENVVVVWTLQKRFKIRRLTAWYVRMLVKFYRVCFHFAGYMPFLIFLEHSKKCILHNIIEFLLETHKHVYYLILLITDLFY